MVSLAFQGAVAGLRPELLTGQGRQEAGRLLPGRGMTRQSLGPGRAGAGGGG